MSSLLIIGGSGFFGKSILDSYKRGLLKKWDINSIYILARNAKNLACENPELINQSVLLINGDISTCESLPKADYVIHAAANTDAARYVNTPDLEKKNIINGTSNFCRLAKKYLRDSKILYVSSGAVYGIARQSYYTFSEDDPLATLKSIGLHKRDYAGAKRASEVEIINLGKLGLSVSIARCFAFIGKYLPRDQHFAIGNFIENGLKNSEIEVKANGNVYRSYMYADDLVYWLFAIMLDGNSTTPIYNVGSAECIEVRELAELIKKRFNCIKISQKKPTNDIDFYVPNIKKAEKNLRLVCKFNIEMALDETIKRLQSEQA